MEDLFDLEILAINSRYFDRYENIPQQYLFHYTNIKNLNSIIQKDNSFKFWMTKSTDFFDKNEGLLISRIYSNVLRDLADKNIVDELTFESIKDLKPLDIKIDFHEFYILQKFDFYVLCLSKQFSSIKMWNEYCDGNNGINIAVPTYLFHSSYFEIENCVESKRKPCFDFYITKVIYDEKDQFEILKNRLCELLVTYNKYQSSGNLKKLKFYICELLKNLCLMFKENKYSTEDEIRIIYQLSKEKQRDIDCVFENNGKHHITLCINNLDMPRIIFSPLFENDKRCSTPNNCTVIENENDL